MCGPDVESQSYRYNNQPFFAFLEGRKPAPGANSMRYFDMFALNQTKLTE